MYEILSNRPTGADGSAVIRYPESRKATTVRMWVNQTFRYIGTGCTIFCRNSRVGPASESFSLNMVYPHLW
jgi:hypothetical protein